MTRPCGINTAAFEDANRKLDELFGTAEDNGRRLRALINIARKLNGKDDKVWRSKQKVVHSPA